jgi:hypothetical protein
VIIIFASIKERCLQVSLSSFLNSINLGRNIGPGSYKIKSFTKDLKSHNIFNSKVFKEFDSNAICSNYPSQTRLFAINLKHYSNGKEKNDSFMGKNGKMIIFYFPRKKFVSKI